MFWLLALLAYLLGSLSFAILLSRLSGAPDPRASGSGNPGATNMLRVAGRKLAVLTLLGDLAKGLLAKIEQALEKIEANEYGLCESCGEEIGLKRLEARPVAELCIDCKSEQEKLERRTS